MVSAAEAAAIAIVVGAYILFVLRERYQVLIAGAGAALLLATGLVPIAALAPTSTSGNGGLLQWNTLALLLGLFVFATLLSLLGFFRWAGITIARRTRDRTLFLFGGLVGLSFVLSAFLDSIVVMLILAAITLEAARDVGQDPVPLVIAEISAANLGGAATFIGDPPNLILGTYFHLSFTDFLVHTGLPSLAAMGVALWLFSRQVDRTPSTTSTPLPPIPAMATRQVQVTLASFSVLLTVLAFQRPLGIPIWTIGLVAVGLGLVLAGPRYVRRLVTTVDYETLVFFLFLFILVGGLESTGVLDSIAGGLGRFGAGDLLLTGSLLLWTFGLLSSVVNNVPLAAAAAPLVSRLGASTGLSTSSLVYAVALGTDIGGNGTPIGASANVVGLGVARRAGVRVGWPEFVRRSFPIMLASLATANLVWLFIR